MILAIYYENEVIGECNTFGETRDAYRVLVGKPEGKKPLGRLRCRQEDNINVDLQKVEWGAWTGLSWFRVGRGGRLL